MRKYLYILALITGLVRLGTGQNQTELFIQTNRFFDSINRAQKAQAVDAVFQEMVKQKQFNGILLVALDTYEIYCNYHGYADYRSRQTLHAGSQYELASVSKQFTAVAILQLYEQGKLQLTDSVCQYLPDFPYKDVTIHQLLCHRSGLPDYLEFAEVYHKNKSQWFDNDSLLRMMQIHHPKISAPANTKFEYSNTGYAVLACLVEKISGEKLEDYFTKHIWQVAGMNHTFLYGRGQFDEQGYTIGHRAGYKTYVRDFMSWVVGDKAVFSTAGDMFKWNIALYERKILNDTTLEMAYSPKNHDMDPCHNYGYGWRLSADPHGNSIIYHGGLWNGNNNLFSRRLYDKACVIILSNEFNRSFGGRGDQILEILYSL